MIWKSTFAAFMLLVCSAWAQRETADDSLYAQARAPRSQLRWTIDTPTAGMLPRGAFEFDTRTFSTGGLQGALGIGLMDRFSVALAYGASYVLTDTIPDWNPRLEFELRYRLLDEGRAYPAIAVGYSSQGYGRYDKENKRYQVKSPGFYLVFSKNFTIYSSTPAGWHWGANYSLENKNDNDPSVFVGFNTELGPDMNYLLEYDFALNDNKRDPPTAPYGMGRGFLNMGLAWYLTEGLSLELDLKNLFRNRKDAHAIDREVRLVYVEFFY